MKKTLLIFVSLTLVFILTVIAQEKKTSLPFIIVIDNEFPDGSDIVNSKLLVTDSLGNLQDSINCDYSIGKLLILKSDYQRLFKFKANSATRIYFQFIRRKLDLGTDFIYKSEFLANELNDQYIILRVFNAYNKESREKYYFKKGQSYIYQIITPGFATILHLLKKE